MCDTQNILTLFNFVLFASEWKIKLEESFKVSHSKLLTILWGRECLGQGMLCIEQMSVIT